MHADKFGLLGCHEPVLSELPRAKLRLNCDDKDYNAGSTIRVRGLRSEGFDGPFTEQDTSCGTCHGCFVRAEQRE
jgi:hypothetical protein